MPLLTLSSISVYRRGEGPSNGDPDAEPVLRMEFPVDPAGNHTFLRSVVEANRRLYNSAALGVAVTGAGKEFSCMERVFIIIRLLFYLRRDRATPPRPHLLVAQQETSVEETGGASKLRF